MSIVLIGPPAAGKSRAGRRLSKRLGGSYADTDKVIVAEHGPIIEIFRQHGEPEFRRIEREVVAEALATHDVVSLGGGAPMDALTQALLESDAHTVVLLTARPEAIAERIGADSKRPLITGIDSWNEIYARRRETYERLADISFDTSFRPMTRIADDIIAWLEEHGRLSPELAAAARVGTPADATGGDDNAANDDDTEPEEHDA